MLYHIGIDIAQALYIYYVNYKSIDYQKKKHIILGILVILYCVITYLTFTTDNLIGFIASYVTTNLLALIIGGFIGYCAAFIGNLLH